MKRIILILSALIIGLTPMISLNKLDRGEEKPIAAAKKTTQKQCKTGYFRNPITNRCKKLVTVTETKSMITTTTYNPTTGQPTVKKVCKSGYWWNKSTERCNKKKVCQIGYRYQSSDNTCKKIVCKFGYKVQDSSNVCKKIICKVGYVLSQKTGNCVKNNNGKYKECESGWTLDLRTLQCALIGTTGSNDPRSKAAKKSQNQTKHYYKKSQITLSSIVTTDTEDEPTLEQESTGTNTEKTCPEGKFLNPKTNRCKNLQEISETSTGKTITTYDPNTGEATTVKICNDGYYLNTETNRCNKVKDATTTTSSVKTCPEGKFLNPKTNRCKNLQTIVESSTGKTITTYDPKTGESKTEKICNEGYELNPETNRCKKAKKNEGEEYKLDVPELGEKTEDSFTAIGSIIAILLIGTGFATFQYRHEIKKFLKSLFPRKNV